jgi:deoxyribodipyrimidine photolyase-like uncharacterized protein
LDDRELEYNALYQEKEQLQTSHNELLRKHSNHDNEIMAKNNQYFQLQKDHKTELEAVRAAMQRHYCEEMENLRAHYVNEERKQTIEMKKMYFGVHGVFQSALKCITGSFEGQRPVTEDGLKEVQGFINQCYQEMNSIQ